MAMPPSHEVEMVIQMVRTPHPGYFHIVAEMRALKAEKMLMRRWAFLESPFLSRNVQGYSVVADWANLIATTYIAK